MDIIMLIINIYNIFLDLRVEMTHTENTEGWKVRSNNKFRELVMRLLSIKYDRVRMQWNLGVD